MERETPRQRIDAALRRIERKHKMAFGVDKMTGGLRLTDVNGAREISPRLPASKFALWLEAFEDGLDVGSEPVVKCYDNGGYTKDCPTCGVRLVMYQPPTAK